MNLPQYPAAVILRAQFIVLIKWNQNGSKFVYLARFIYF